MKKLIGILFSIALIHPCFAYQDLILSNKETITQINNLNPETISIEQVYTIMNERNCLIVNITGEGTAKFALELETGKTVNFELLATKTKTEIKKSAKGFEIFTIDDYIKEMELDLPPGVTE